MKRSNLRGPTGFHDVTPQCDGTIKSLTGGECRYPAAARSVA